jgi:CBS domain-containing protein
MNAPVSTLLAEKGATVLSIPSTVTVEEAVQVMNRFKVGSIVVVDDGQLTGIFTERDVLYRVVAQGLTPATTPLAQVMTRNPKTITPDTSVQDALAFISEKRVRHLPIIDDGRLVGMISQGDITRWLVNAHKAEAEHLMNYITGGLST